MVSHDFNCTTLMIRLNTFSCLLAIEISFVKCLFKLFDYFSFGQMCFSWFVMCSGYNTMLVWVMFQRLYPSPLYLFTMSDVSEQNFIILLSLLYQSFLLWHFWKCYILKFSFAWGHIFYLSKNFAIYTYTVQLAVDCLFFTNSTTILLEFYSFEFNLLLFF